MSDPSVSISGEPHQGSQGYGEDQYMIPYEGSQTSTPRTMQSASTFKNSNFATAKTQMLGSEGRPMHMNTSAVVGSHPMSSVVYGFRPESGWAGVLFQIFLQGSWVAIWQKQKELDFWISFQGHDVPAVLYEMESTVMLPEIGTKRYVLQCIIPERFGYDHCSITLSVNGLGGKTIVGGLFIGKFQYRPDDGTLMTYHYHKNLNELLRWLKENPPQGIDYPSPINENEQCEEQGDNTVEIVAKMENLEMQHYEYPDISQDSSNFSQYQRDMQSQLWAVHSIDAAQQEPYNELFHQNYQSQDSLSIPTIDLHFNPSGHDPIQQGPQITQLRVRSDLQPYAFPQAGMSQSAAATPRRRVECRSHHPYRPNQSYGKMAFVHKPDQLGDISQWTLQECQENRRIVAFHKVARGDVIQLDCFPVPAQDYRESMITISCIRWIPSPPHELNHKLAGKCVFTSVDIILLLERLTRDNGQPLFSVQEKNRIRRNLEGYHPKTVKKEGVTLRFFNQVMSYAQPKARNIEKDIKVFLWSDITKALRKIVQKYTLNGSISLGRPNSEPGLSSQAFTTTSQSSSTESLATQHSFLENDYSQPILEWQHQLGQEYSYPIVPSSSSPHMLFKGDENGYSSGCSISSQSQVSQLDVPVEYGQVSGGVKSSSPSRQQGLDGYVHGIPADFLL